METFVDFILMRVQMCSLAALFRTAPVVRMLDVGKILYPMMGSCNLLIIDDLV